MNAGRRAGRCSCAAVVEAAAAAEAAAAVGANVRRASFGNRSSGVVDPPQLDPPRGAQPTAPRPAPPRSSPGAATSEGRTAPRRTLGRVLEDFDAETSVELSVAHGEILVLIADGRAPEGWVWACSPHSAGLVPAAFVQALDVPGRRPTPGTAEAASRTTLDGTAMVHTRSPPRSASAVATVSRQLRRPNEDFRASPSRTPPSATPPARAIVLQKTPLGKLEGADGAAAARARSRSSMKRAALAAAVATSRGHAHDAASSGESPGERSPRATSSPAVNAADLVNSWIGGPAAMSGSSSATGGRAHPRTQSASGGSSLSGSSYGAQPQNLTPSSHGPTSIFATGGGSSSGGMLFATGGPSDLRT